MPQAVSFRHLYQLSIGLGVVFLAASLTLGRQWDFTAQIPLLNDAPTEVLLLPTGPAQPKGLLALKLEALQRGVEKKDLALPPEVAEPLAGDSNYDLYSLPFRVNLAGREQLRPESRIPYLEIEEAGAMTQVNLLDPGESLSIGGEAVELFGARPWAGIVSAPGGEPHVVLVQRGSNPLEEARTIVGPQWQDVEGGTMRCAWFDSEADARQALTDGSLLQLERWGVREGDRVHWFTSFAPGTGIELDDGRIITLAGRRSARAESGEPPGIGVEVSGSTGVRRFFALANQADDESEVVYEAPGRAARSFILAAWTPDDVLLATYAFGTLLRTDPMPRWLPVATEAFSSPHALVNALSDAVPAVDPDTTVHEYVLRLGEKILCLRGGERVALVGVALRFLEDIMPAEERMEIAISHDSHSHPKLLTLSPGERVSNSFWTFSQAASPASTAAVTWLDVSYAPPNPLFWLGVCLFLFGLIKEVLARGKHKG